MSRLQAVITTDLQKSLQSLVKNYTSDMIFIVTDEVVKIHCLPALLNIPAFQDCHVCVLPIGEKHKNLESVERIWHFLLEHGATRNGLVLNLGGGMVTDLGGFAASTFKRGMRYVNLPTTILAAVDAATGGKTGFNFMGLKNEIGLYNLPQSVVVNVNFFRTLDHINLISGFAEMMKHALISDMELLRRSLSFDLEDVDYEELEKLVEQNISIKQHIVQEDPHEKGIRKALNFGHTFGHAFETMSYRINRPMTHGIAVMWGCVCAAYLSHIRLNFPKEMVSRLLYFTKANYGLFPFTCKEYDALLELMKHDKKNENHIINFSLLFDVGNVSINQTASKEEIFETLDFVREN